jgi:hypothetical protein
MAGRRDGSTRKWPSVRNLSIVLLLLQWYCTASLLLPLVITSLENLGVDAEAVLASMELPILGLDPDDHTDLRFLENRRADFLVKPDGEPIQQLSSNVKGVKTSMYNVFAQSPLVSCLGMLGEAPSAPRLILNESGRDLAQGRFST